MPVITVMQMNLPTFRPHCHQAAIKAKTMTVPDTLRTVNIIVGTKTGVMRFRPWASATPRVTNQTKAIRLSQ